MYFHTTKYIDTSLACRLFNSCLLSLFGNQFSEGRCLRDRNVRYCSGEHYLTTAGPLWRREHHPYFRFYRQGLHFIFLICLNGCQPAPLHASRAWINPRAYQDGIHTDIYVLCVPFCLSYIAHVAGWPTMTELQIGDVFTSH